MGLATVNNQTMAIKEYMGQRVLAFKDIDTVHGRPNGTARKRFNDNRSRFIDGVDYFKLQPSENRTLGINSPNGAIVITESGYLMLAKSFTDDLAWTVQRELVNCYFRNKPQTASPTKYEQLTLEGNNSARAVLDAAGYSYQDKTFNGDPVVTLNDIAYITGISADSLKYVLKTHGAYGRDYYKISGAQMIKFKQQNTSCPRCWTHLILVTKSGFTLLAKYYNLTNNTPQCFITDNKPAVVEKPKKSVSVPAAHRPTTDEYIIALNVLRYLNDTNKKLCEETDTMKDYYRSSIESMDAAIKNIGTAISVG